MTVSAEIQDRIAKCQKILQADPNSQIFAALAEAHRKKGDLDSAFRVCQSGLKIHPSYGSAHLVMAKINLDRGLYDWAEAEVEKAKEIDGNSRSIELLKAEIFIYRGEYEEAIRLLKQLHDANPANEQIRKLLDIASQIPEDQRLTAEQPAKKTRKQTEEIVLPNTEALQPSAPPDEGNLDAAQILQAATEIDEISGGLLVNSEGLILESQWRHDLDPTVSAATMAKVDIFLCQELVKASFGSCHTVLIETTGPVFYLHRTNGGTFLFVATSRINLGPLRMKLGKLLSRFSEK